MVEPRDDDLVAMAPALGQGARYLEGQRRGTPAEDNPARVGVHEVGSGLSCRDRDIVGVSLGLGDPPAIRHPDGERPGDGGRDGIRGLGAARAIEERDP